MSGEWMKAARRTYLYEGTRGDGQVSNQTTRLVLSELCAVANEAGVAYTTHAKLSERTRVNARQVKRAVARLKDDGWLCEVRRGIGTKHRDSAGEIKKRPSVYLIARLPIVGSECAPAAAALMVKWAGFTTKGELWQTVKKYEEQDWRQAHAKRQEQPETPVDNLPQFGPYKVPVDSYKVPVKGLQGASSGNLLNNSKQSLRDKQLVSGDKPHHWDKTRSTASLSVVADTEKSSSKEVGADHVVADPDPPANPDPQAPPRCTHYRDGRENPRGPARCAECIDNLSGPEMAAAKKDYHARRKAKAAGA